MTVLAQNAEVGIGLQTAKETLASEGGGAGSATNYWYRFKALNATWGTIEDNRVSPPEIGGDVYPTGAYKAGAYVLGDLIIQPRLSDIGFLLFATCGDVCSISDVPEAGLYTHVFRPLTTNHSTMKWLSFRRSIPGKTLAEDVGEVGQDCRVIRTRFTVPQNGTVTAALSVVGRIPTYDDAPSAWTWRNTYPTFDSVPISVKGHFEVPDGTLKPALGATVDVINQFTTPRDEMIIGEYYPDDFECLYRQLQTTWVYKWENAALYKAILAAAGAGDGMQAIPWSPVVYDQSFDLQVESPGNVNGYSNPYSLKFYAPDMHWQVDGPPALAGGDMIRMRFTGTGLDPLSGDYFQITLVNETPGYIWPS